jgi:hypothetical protein
MFRLIFDNHFIMQSSELLIDSFFSKHSKSVTRKVNDQYPHRIFQQNLE